MLTAEVLHQNYNDIMGNQKNDRAIENLVESIGLEDASDLLHSTQHLMVQRQEELEAALRQNDEITSKRCALRTVGSIRLYGSARLETLLSQIATKPFQEVNTAVFQQELSEEFASVIETVNSWLDRNA